MKPLPKLKKCIGAECKGCRECFVDGGAVDDIAWEEEKSKKWAAKSEEEKKKAVKIHYAEGGDVESNLVPKDEDGNEDGDDSMLESVAGELLQAFESKNKKEILEAIRAIVLSCKE